MKTGTRVGDTETVKAKALEVEDFLTCAGDAEKRLAEWFEQSSCPTEFKVHKACPPPLEGQAQFEHTNTVFADQGIVTGSSVLLDCGGHRFFAEITWLDWNVFRYRQVV